MTRSRRYARITSRHRDIEHLRSCNIDLIVRREFFAQLPNAREERIMGISGKGKVKKIFEHLRDSPIGQNAVMKISSKDLCHFKVEEVRP
jgi:hypothetical protein